MKFFNKQKNSAGFTLIETMVAVFILTIALTALLNLTAQSLFTARYARNEITANYLMQEAVDYIRNQRDSFAFLQKNNGKGWQFFLDEFGQTNSNLCFSTNGCYFNVNESNLSINECKESTSFKCPAFYYDADASSSGSFYNYDINYGLLSNFKRKIHLGLNSSNGDELYVTVTMEWLNGNLTRTRSLKMSLLNWLP